MPAENLDNLRRVWSLADQIDRREGMAAYCRYQFVMLQLADHYSFSFEAVTGAFCALSPNNDYLGNLRSLVTVLRAYREGRTLAEVTVSTYRHAARRAWRCLAGEDFLHFTRGLKTRSFYLNICEPFDREPVTIDGHMIGLWSGHRLRMKEAKASPVRYREIAADFRTVAAELGILPNQLQAALWFTWKRINRIIYKSQLGLFTPRDQWRLAIMPQHIKPFFNEGREQQRCTDQSATILDTPAAQDECLPTSASNNSLLF
jgi:hypothetical protein